MKGCYCSLIEDGKILICHHHFKALREDSNLQSLTIDKDVEIEYINNIPIVRHKL